MKSRKRILSLLLALLMLVSLFPTAALAEAPEEEAPAFLVQPESGSHPQGERYLLTWELNRTPDRLELVREEPVGVDVPGDPEEEPALLPVQELAPTDTSLELTAPETETVFHLRAFFGEEELVSEPFTVSVILSEAKDLDGDSSSAEPPQNDKEEDVPGDADEPEAAPAPADEPEGTHRLTGRVVTYKSGGAVDSLNPGATIQVSASNPSSGTNVSCEVTLNSGYRLLAVFYGPTDGTAAMDVTDSMPVRMWDQNMAFVACVIPESGIMPCEHAALSITAPSLGGSYSGTVNASVTKYFNDGNTGFSALGAYSVLSAVWKEEGGTNPTSFQVGKSYYTVITLKPTSGWGFPTDCYAQLTMPNGLKVNSGTGDVTVSRLPNGNLRIQSPLYTIPETEGWYNLYGYASTLDANGVYDSSLSGGTIQLSTGCAQEGSSVSCTVTPADGYRLISVLYGPDGDEPIEDVSGTRQSTMGNCDMSFRAYFIAEDAVAPNYGAAVSIGAPAAGGSYPNGVPVSTTNYYSFSAHVNAVSAYHVENAVWTIKYGGTPTTLLAGHKYCAEFDLVANTGWRLFDTISVELTMPDGTVLNSAIDSFTVTRNADGSFHVISPEVTVPGSSSYHNLMGRALTYDENGNPDTTNAGGTVTVSASSAKAGDPVSCQVTVNPGYRLLMVQFCLDHDEPVADVTDTWEGVMWDRDMEFRATFVKDGGSINCSAAAVRLDYPNPSGYTSLPAAPVLTPYLSMTSMAIYPSAFSVTDGSWRNDDGNCIGWFYDVQDYYALFTLRPNEGWKFMDNCAVELTMPDGSVLNSGEGDFTITRNADGSITVKSPLLHVPNTEQPTGGAIPVVFEAKVYDANYHIIPDVIGGTASFSPAHPRAGDTVTVTAEPAPGYQLQYVLYDDGVTMGYDATPEMSYVIPANYGTLTVCFTPVGTSLPLPSATQKVELPLAGTQNSGAGQVLNGEHQWYDVESVTWYGGAGSGCQDQEPESFLPDAYYYAEVVLTPHEHWHWDSDTQPLMLYHDPNDPDPDSVNWNLHPQFSGSTCTVDDQGRLHVVGEELLLPMNAETAVHYRDVHVSTLVMNANGSTNSEADGGRLIPSTYRVKVGDTLIFGVMPKNGYRLQWMTAARDSEQIGEDITDSLEFYVADEPGDVYVLAFFALADEPVTCSTVDLNVQLPAPGGNYSGLAPATVTPNAVNASKYTVVSARWYEPQQHGVGTPSSFVPGEQYCVEIILAPNPGWSFGDNPGAFLLFSDGTGMDSRFGEVFPYKQSDGNLVLTSNFITLPEVEIDSVEGALTLPALGGSYSGPVPADVTVLTPAQVSVESAYWYNAWGIAPGSFEAGEEYFASFTLKAKEGYVFPADLTVTLQNAQVEGVQLEDSRTALVTVSKMRIPTDSYQLSGTYVKFRLNGEEISSARPGDYVVVRTDITTQPEGVYLANVTSEDVELTQLTDITWGFTMPAKNVSVTGELLPQETYIFELEDMTHDVNAADARWLFGEQEAGTRLEEDLDYDGYTDIFVDYYEDGTVRVIRVGSIYGDFIIQTPSGRFGTRIYRFGPERYDVYLGSVQVNAENKDNIPVLGGKASYDPDTHTLHLDGYTGSIGVARKDSAYPSLTNSFSITASGDLTVTGSGVLLDASLRGGISCGGNLTLNGDFVIHAWLHGIYVEGDLTVSGNVKVHDTTQVGVGVGGTLRVLLGSLRVTTDEGIGVDSRGDVIVAGDLHSEAGEAGLQCGGVVRLMGGALWADSQNDIGLICTGALDIKNGGLTASGNVQAIEAGSISYPDTHFIRMPENGTVSGDGSTVIDPATNAPALNAQITDRKPTVSLSVKDLEGSEGVGGTVAINSGAYSTTASGSFNYGTQITIRAQAAEGYRFDHWEDVFGDYFTDESQSLAIQVGVYVDAGYVAVFEELLPITEPYFPDEVFRNYVATCLDQDSDGYLSWAERNAVTSISVNNMNIVSLEGIRYFPELTELLCANCSLEGTLDLHWNTKLTDVRCPTNTKLTGIDVSGCPELTTLYTYACSRITSLDLSNNTKLEHLLCYMSGLTSLDVSMCRNLKNLQCYSNSNLTELRVNSNVMYRLFCYGTKLNTLDLSSCELMARTYNTGTHSTATNYEEYVLKNGNTTIGTIRCNKNAVLEDDLGIPINKPNFPDDTFRQYVSERYDKNRNDWLSPSEIAPITSIELEEHPELTSVQGIGFFTELTYIMLNFNPKLKELDVSNNTKLTGMEVTSNGLTTLTLGQQPDLEFIYLNDNELTTLDLSGAPNLTQLDVAENPLRSIDLSAAPDLNALYIFSTELEELDLTDNPILLDAYLNGTRTVHEDLGYVEYAGGPLGGRLLIDQDQTVITEKPHIPGDINGDGNVDGTDVVLLATYVKAGGSGVTIVPGSGDVNGDGRVDGTDVALLATYVKAGGQGVVIH